MVQILPEDYTFETLSIPDAQLMQSRIRMRIGTLEAETEKGRDYNLDILPVVQELGLLDLALSEHVNKEVARMETEKRLHKAAKATSSRMI
jgi:hypothetical protein